jgi:stearoyl-CoA desaturase (Delta-9 desaturase)
MKNAQETAVTEARVENPPRNWTVTLMFMLTGLAAVTVVPWYGLTAGYSTVAWVSFVLLLGANGMSITCGYHRLFAHSTYEARPLLKLAYLLFGAMALQNSALVWSTGHRKHHRFIDDNDHDPYSARRGFWFSHIGWMLREHPSGVQDLRTVQDLQRDPLVMWQHRNYLAIALAMNIGLPLLIGWIAGDIAGVFLLAGILRLVASHHFTFFINSLAHIWGYQPYTDENTARDNGVVALLTYGEGYHNFHHMFAHDYRNGVRWWQFDPSKWFIAAMSWLGLARNLKRVPWFKIQRALLDTQFARAQKKLAGLPSRAHLEQLRSRLAEEYEAFVKVVAEWSHLREQWIEETRRAVVKRWERSHLQSQLKELECRLQSQYRRMRVLQAQIG